MKRFDRLLSLALTAAALAPPGASGADELERFRPVLRYDSREQYLAQPVSLPPPTAEVVSGEVIYGHVAREDDETWLQYWLFYAHDPQDWGVLGTGRHEGDWELVQFRLGEGGEPDLATLAQHATAEGCRWEELELETVDGGQAPVIYVANGSHAAYSGAGVHDRPWPDPNDEADGGGEVRRPAVMPIRTGHPDWLAYPERWGSSEAGPFPGESSSPLGPRFQEGSAWRRPASFHDERARPCGSPPPGRPWQTPALAGVALALGAAAVILWRRRRLYG